MNFEKRKDTEPKGPRGKASDASYLFETRGDEVSARPALYVLDGETGSPEFDAATNMIDSCQLDETGRICPIYLIDGHVDYRRTDEEIARIPSKKAFAETQVTATSVSDAGSGGAEDEDVLQVIETGESEYGSRKDKTHPEEVSPTEIVSTEVDRPKINILNINSLSESVASAVDLKNSESAPVTAAPEEIAAQEVPTKNYVVVPKLLENAVDWHGKPVLERSIVHAQVSINTKKGLEQRELSFPVSKIENLTQIVRRNCSTAALYDRSAAYQVEIEFREQMCDVDKVICYLDHGWQLINGYRVYVHRGANVPGKVMTNMELPADPTICLSNCYDVWLKSMSLSGQSGVMAVMSIFSFLGVTWKLFDEAGFPPRFVLFMTGKSGSYKTAMAKVLYTQVEEASYRQYPRRLDSDTRVSLERGLVLSGRDNITLIDDFSPAATPQKKAKLENDLESVVRAVGDGSSKSRSNAMLEDRRGEGIRGCVVITGELRGEGLSSNLRCLYCAIDGQSVDVDVLSWFQERYGAYESIIQFFINFLAKNWENVRLLNGQSFNSYRKEARRVLNTGRLSDALATLWIMTDIVCGFFITDCGMQDCGGLFEKIKGDMISVLMESERISFEEDPAVTFMRALATMLENQQLKIKPERFTKADLSAYDGFSEHEFLYLMPNQVYQKVCDWIRHGGGRMTLSEKEISSALAREGHTVTSSNGNGKRILYARISISGTNNRMNFWKLKKQAIDSFSISEPDFF